MMTTMTFLYSTVLSSKVLRPHSYTVYRNHVRVFFFLWPAAVFIAAQLHCCRAPLEMPLVGYDREEKYEITNTPDCTPDIAYVQPSWSSRRDREKQRFFKSALHQLR